MHGDTSSSEISLYAACLGICKGVVGPAILYIPFGFHEGGYYFAIPMLIVSCFLFNWGMTGLMQMCLRESQSFYGMMGIAFGSVGVWAVKIIIFMQQSGVCMSYFIFVSSNLVDLLEKIELDVSPVTLCFFQLILYLPLSMITDMKTLRITNLIGSTLIVFSIIVLVAYASIQVTEDPDYVTAFDSKDFFEFIGTSAFMWEGMGSVVIPLQSSVRSDLRQGFPRLFQVTTTCIVAVYIVFGLLNYVAYGNDVQTVLTLNLPANSSWKIAVQIAYIFAVVFTFPLQIHPALEILCEGITKLHCAKGNKPGLKENLRDHPDFINATSEQLLHSVNGSEEEIGNTMTSEKPMRLKIVIWLTRGLVVVLIGGISAFCVDVLDVVVSIIGALFGIPLIFIFPNAIHLKVAKDRPLSLQLVDGAAVTIGCVLVLVCCYSFARPS